MAAFATPTELAAFLQRDINTASAAQALDLASDAVREEVLQDVDVATTTETLDGNGLPWLFLEQVPVTEVVSVTEDGVALVEGTDFRWRKNGMLGRWRGDRVAMGVGAVEPTSFWTPGFRTVVVEYIHGWAPTTREWRTCKRIALQVAGRSYVNPGQHSAREVGQTKETWGVQASPGRIELVETEKRDLDPLRRAGT